MQEAVEKYVHACHDDLDAAQILIDGGQCFYTPFLCHQALQKILRGLFLETQNRYPPVTADLLSIADGCDAGKRLDAPMRVLLQSLSVYPEVIGNPVYRKKILEQCTQESARDMLKQTKAIVRLVRSLID